MRISSCKFFQINAIKHISFTIIYYFEQYLIQMD